MALYRYLLASLACPTVVCLTASIPAGAQTLSGWDSVWTDEFNGTDIDYSRWEVADRRDSPNNELQYYRPEQVSVGNGQLTITAVDQWLVGKPYRSGLIRTWQEHQYGRWEVRADLPYGQGMWPAIWLLPRNAAWPVGGEIDIMENVGNNTFFVKGSYHYNWTPGSPITSNNDYITGEDFAAGMHNYAVEWSPEQLRFYVDDNLYHVVDNPIQPDSVPMSLIINLAVGGDWPGSPDGSTVFPQTFDVDYARYWTRDEGELINDSFDRSGNTINGWTIFGNEIGNVSAQAEAVTDGSHALKLYGQFNNAENFSGAAQGIVVRPGQDVVADASAFIRSQDSIFGTDNQVFMKLEYYSSFGADISSPDFLSEVPLLIADGSTVTDTWFDHQISGVAPAGAVEARVSFVFRQPGVSGGAIHIDDVSLVATAPVIVGDLTGDGFVGINDLNVILVNWNSSATPGAYFDPSGDGFVGIDDLNIVLAAWNSGTPPAELSVPEPGTLATLATACALLASRRRKMDT